MIPMKIECGCIKPLDTVRITVANAKRFRLFKKIGRDFHIDVLHKGKSYYHVLLRGRRGLVNVFSNATNL